MANTDKQKPAEARAYFDLSALSHIGAVITPIVIALTGLLYIAGYTQRVMGLGRFGLDGAFAEPSLQMTLAEGFPIILIGSIIIGGLITFIWLIDKYTNNLIKKIRKGRRGRRGVPRSVKRALKINSFSTKFLIAFLLLSYGFVSGGISGDVVAAKMKNLVDKGCKQKCFRISTSYKRYSGMIVAQDQQRVAIYTKAGIFMIDAKEIRKIEPIGFETSSIFY